MGRPNGGWISGYTAPTMDTARGVWSPRESLLAQQASSWPQPDTFFSNVQALLHCEGTNGSTTFTDSSSFGRTYSVTSGTPTISTASRRFGNSSVVLPSSTSCVRTVSSAMSVGSADFTLEFWLQLTSIGMTGAIISSNVSGVGRWLVAFNTGLLFQLFGTGGGFVLQVGFGQIVQSQWTHVAIARSGATLRAYANGALSSTSNVGTTVFASDSNTGLYIGQATGAASATTYLDEIRLTVGTARYTGSTYTVPNGAYPDR